MIRRLKVGGKYWDTGRTESALIGSSGYPSEKPYSNVWNVFKHELECGHIGEILSTGWLGGGVATVDCKECDDTN